MNYCGTCCFFGEELIQMDRETFNPKGTGWHTCEAVRHIIFDTIEGEAPDSNAMVNDGSGYFAALRVTCDFGCVNYKEKR